MPLTFWLGAAVIVVAEVLLFVDVARRDAPVAGALGRAARWVAVNMTPICWVGFLLVMDGLLAWRGRRGGRGSPARNRPIRFAVCFVTSVGVWSFFDWVNFSFIQAWTYVGLEPLSVPHVLIAKFVAFGAISPAMFMCAALYQQLGLAHFRAPAIPKGPAVPITMFVIGVPALAFPFIVRNPVGCLALWVSLVLVLAPVNLWVGRGRTPSLIVDWRAGRWGRTVSLMAAGLTCGLLWEFWNYWAAAKWIYHLPFLGPLESVRLFEMPLPGFGGFLPFALECWVAFESILLALSLVGLRFFEPLPDDDAVL